MAIPSEDNIHSYGSYEPWQGRQHLVSLNQHINYMHNKAASKKIEPQLEAGLRFFASTFLTLYNIALYLFVRFEMYSQKCLPILSHRHTSRCRN